MRCSIYLVVAAYLSSHLVHAANLVPPDGGRSNNACAQLTAVDQTTPNEELLGYIRACNRNTDREICEATLFVINSRENPKEKWQALGLTCDG